MCLIAVSYNESKRNIVYRLENVAEMTRFDITWDDAEYNHLNNDIL